jgi:ATP-binding cassette subfamily B protein
MGVAVDSVLGTQPLPRALSAVLPTWTASSDLRLLLTLMVFYVLLAVVGQLQQVGSTLLSAQAASRMTLAFRSRLFSQAQVTSLVFHDRRGTADSIYRIQHDAPGIYTVVVTGLVGVASSLVLVVAVAVSVFKVDWQLGLVAVAVTPLLAAYAHVYNRRMRSRYEGAKGLESNALAVVQEALTALRVVKVFGGEAVEQRRFDEQAGASVHAHIHLAFVEALFGALVNLTIALGGAAVLFFGVRRVEAGALSLGQLLIMVTYVAQLHGPIGGIARQVAGLQDGLASTQRGFELLDRPHEVSDRPNALPLARARGAISFEHVSFSYDGRRPILNEISLEVDAGMRVGIIGKTGAGKTTLVSLLMRLYEPQKGRILLDGVDVRAYRLADLRSQFSLILQESVLFSTTIAENIAYGRPGATAAEVVAAAEAAQLGDLLAHLPDGYDTLVGEHGHELSGGERQRIALARAYLKNSPILILDEPTSSLDAQTEAEVIIALDRLAEGRTTLMISHRVSALEGCEKLLELKSDSDVVTYRT